MKPKNTAPIGTQESSADLVFLEQDVGLGQVLHLLIPALQLLLKLAEPLLQVRQALVVELRAVGVKEQPGLLLRGGLQLVPQLVELGQALCHDGFKLGLGLHERLALLCSTREDSSAPSSGRMVQRSSRTNLVHFVEPALVGGQLGHEGLVLEPFAVQVPGLVVRRVLGREHLLVDPQSQLKQEGGGDQRGVESGAS